MQAIKEVKKDIQAELLKASEVAVALGVGTARVHQLIRAGELPAVSVGNRGVRIPRQAFEEYLHGLNQVARAKMLVKDIEKAVALDSFLQAFDHVDFDALHKAFAQAIGKAAQHVQASPLFAQARPLVLEALKEAEENKEAEELKGNSHA